MNPRITRVPHGKAALCAYVLAGRSAFVARTVQLDGFGAADATEVAIVDHRGIRAGSILSRANGSS